MNQDLPPLNIPSPPGSPALSRRGSVDSFGDDGDLRFLPSPELVRQMHREHNYPELVARAHRINERRRVGPPPPTSTLATRIYTPEEEFMNRVKFAMERGHVDKLESMKKDLSKIQPKHFLLHYAATYAPFEVILWLIRNGYEEEFLGAALLLAINPKRHPYMGYMKDAAYPTENLRIVRWFLGKTELYPFERVQAVMDQLSDEIGVCKDIDMMNLVHTMAPLDLQIVLDSAIHNDNIVVIHWLLSEAKYVPSKEDMEYVERHSTNEDMFRLMGSYYMRYN